jgi:hypothetical protein
MSKNLKLPRDLDAIKDRDITELGRCIVLESVVLGCAESSCCCSAYTVALYLTLRQRHFL